MRRSRFSEDQIMAALAEHETGVKTKELCSKLGISDWTFYKWKAKFGGKTVSETAGPRSSNGEHTPLKWKANGGKTVPETVRLRTLEEENRRLKKLLVESILDNAVLKDLLTKT